MTTITEVDVEQVALGWLRTLGWRVVHGSEITPDGTSAERVDFGQVLPEYRLRDALLPGLVGGEVRMSFIP